MKKFNLLDQYPPPKDPRYVSKNIRTISNRIIASYKNFEFYDGDRNNGFGGFKYDGRWLPIAKKIINHYKLKENSKILHIGCDKGFLLNDFLIINKNLNVYGAESSQYAIDNSLNSVKSKIKYKDEYIFDLEDGYFDFIIAIGVVYAENLKRAIKIIKEIQRLSNGKSFITLASYRNKEEYDLFKDWTLLGTLILKENEWEEVMTHCGYTGDYYFTNAKSLNLKRN